MRRNGKSLFQSFSQINNIKEKCSERTKALDSPDCSFTVSDHNYIEDFFYCVLNLHHKSWIYLLQGDESEFNGTPTLLWL